MLASVRVDRGRMFLLFSVWDCSWRSQWCLSLSKSKQSFTHFPVSMFQRWRRGHLLPVHSGSGVFTVCALLNVHRGLTHGSNACTQEVLETRCKRSNNPPANISSAQIKQATESAESQRSSKAAAGRVPAPSLRDSLASNRTLPLAKALIRGAVL